jgi:hypothetical protein
MRSLWHPAFQKLFRNSGSENIVPLRFLFCVLAFSSLAVASSFDKPLATKTVDLGPSKSNPPGTPNPVHDVVRCFYFPTFMVKEVDLKEKGAERLAVIPAGKVPPPCTRTHGQTEKVVKDWSGYFKGVKGDLVFFDADDGWNGGMGFVVYDAKTVKRVFEDVAQGDLQFSASGTPKITLKYMRVVDAECDVTKEQATCWLRVQKRFGLEALAAPDCNTGYEKSAQELAKGRCQAQSSDNPQCLAKEIELARRQTIDAPSVIAYPVEVVLNPKPAIKTVAGSVGCWPAD